MLIETNNGEKIIMERHYGLPTNKKCYITGQDHTQEYYFGTPGHVLLSLTQDAFAHFVIRAGKDTMHRQIMADIKALYEKIDAFSAEHQLPPEEDDRYVDAAIHLNILADEKAKLLTQKCESGVRILRQIRADFQKHGKLSS
jgi:hypothetical protein